MLRKPAAMWRAAWPLLHAAVFGLTACCSAAPPATPRSPAAAPAIATHTSPRGQPTAATARACGRGTTESQPGYALRPGDWLASLHQVGPGGGGDPRGAFAPWPELGAAPPRLGAGTVRLLVEEGRAEA